MNNNRGAVIVFLWLTLISYALPVWLTCSKVVLVITYTSIPCSSCSVSSITSYRTPQLKMSSYTKQVFTSTADFKDVFTTVTKIVASLVTIALRIAVTVWNFNSTVSVNVWTVAASTSWIHVWKTETTFLQLTLNLRNCNRGYIHAVFSNNSCMAVLLNA